MHSSVGDSVAARTTPAPPLIFVVDDEPLLLELAEAVLLPLGHKVSTFTDPTETLNAFSKARPYPDVLVTDYSMENMSGTELMNACRKVNPRLKTVILSGTVAQEVPHGENLPAEQFLHKPYHPDELVQCVQTLLGRC